MSREPLAKNVSPGKVKDFFESYVYDGRAFVLVGMGPSFSKIGSFDLSHFNTFGINKVVREIKVDINQIIDFYIIDKVKDYLDNCKYMVVPYFPHFGYRPHINLQLSDCIFKYPTEKVYGYNLSTMPISVTRSPMVHAQFFSAESALHMIALLGCKKVYAIGIDGGHERAVEYKDHGPCDPRGFDLQWKNMAKVIRDFNLSYSNLDGSPLNPKLQEMICRTS